MGKGALNAASRLPTDEPPFTLKDLKDAIPSHCFVRSTTTSLAYTAIDMFYAFVLYTLSEHIDTLGVSEPVRWSLWAAYWWWQGAVLTGLWVIAHECGHRAFSDHIWFGDLVGTVLHSFLLVPYHSWRISHAQHHKSTNDMDNDQVFVPWTRSEMGPDYCPEKQDELPEVFSAFWKIAGIAKFLIFGWPAYLATHAAGKKYDDFKGTVNHFSPSSPIFLPKEYLYVVQSDVALLAMIGGLYYAGSIRGFAWLAKAYIVPYLVVNGWLVCYTDLQHTDVRLPHYRSPAWNWLKGALCTLDRDYGVMNSMHHHIGDTHVAHHLISSMPHYHAEEATAAIKPILGDFYLVDNKTPGLIGVAEALWETAGNCRFVEDHGDTLWWKRASTDPKTD